MGISQDLDSLDPHKAVAAGSSEVLFNIFEGLVKASSDSEVREAVASDYGISEDGLKMCIRDRYENRTYLANGPEGYLTLRESPQSSAEVINIVNGESVYVGYLWTDGKGDQWGVAEYGVTSDSGERTWHDGWAPLSQLALVYDHICFEEDHGDELEAYDGSGDVLTEIMVYDLSLIHISPCSRPAAHRPDRRLYPPGRGRGEV